MSDRLLPSQHVLVNTGDSRAPGTSVSVTQSLPLSREITITAGQWSAADKYSALCLSLESQTRAQRAADVTDRDRERDAWPQSRVRSAGERKPS